MSRIEGIESGAQIRKVVAATFEAWRESERLEVCQDIVDNSIKTGRTYGSENPHEPRFRESRPTSMRSGRTLHIGEINDQVKGSVRIGKVNRFKAR